MLIYTVRAMGINMIIMPLTTWAMTDFRGESVPHANAVLNTMRQVAGSVGTAIFVSIYMIVSTTAQSPVLEASLSGFHYAFGAATVLSFAVVVLAYFKVEYTKKNA